MREETDCIQTYESTSVKGVGERDEMLEVNGLKAKESTQKPELWKCAHWVRLTILKPLPMSARVKQLSQCKLGGRRYASRSWIMR